MTSLSEILDDAHGGEVISALGREFGLTPAQTQAAVTALLPAISLGLKQSTATPEGLGNLFGVMGAQQHLQEMYEDPKTAFGREGRVAGDEVLSSIFGSPDVSRAVAEQGQHFSGVTSGVLKQMLPILAGILVSGLTRSGSGKAASPVQPGSPTEGGGLGDILGQIFGRGLPGLGFVSRHRPERSDTERPTDSCSDGRGRTGGPWRRSPRPDSTRIRKGDSGGAHKTRHYRRWSGPDPHAWRTGGSVAFRSQSAADARRRRPWTSPARYFWRSDGRLPRKFLRDDRDSHLS